jgi:fluoroacetyl-CoA thioesterase
MDLLTPGFAADPAAWADLVGRAWLQVGDEDTAAAVGSGDVPVLATPRLLALAEAATVDAIRPVLQDGTTTVGTGVTLSHLAPSAVGTGVAAEARLTAVDGRVLRFDITVRDGVPSRSAAGEQGGRIVATGVIERAAVGRERFLAGVEAHATRDPQTAP